MGSNCCQEANHEAGSVQVAVDDLKAAIEAESIGESGAREVASKTEQENLDALPFDSGHTSDARPSSRSNDVICPAGQAVKVAITREEAARSSPDASGEGRLPAFPKEETAGRPGGAFEAEAKQDGLANSKAKQPAGDRVGRIRHLEDKLSSLKAELATVSRQLQAARGDPKTPIWIEIPRAQSGRDEHSDVPIDGESEEGEGAGQALPSRRLLLV
mmetsp:Transcript_15817/g.35877  ORF Transcript_15817/g.35877 Transcript_15817/m.35877 type:complete len:216 (-) Transcript_15817:78-725(-)